MNEIEIKIPKYFVEIVNLKNCIRGLYHIDYECKFEERCKKCYFYSISYTDHVMCKYAEYITEATHGKICYERDSYVYYWKQFICSHCGELVHCDESTNNYAGYYFNYRYEYRCKKCNTPHMFIKDVQSESNDGSWDVMFAVPIVYNGGN